MTLAPSSSVMRILKVSNARAAPLFNSDFRVAVVKDIFPFTGIDIDDRDPELAAVRCRVSIATEACWRRTIASIAGLGSSPLAS